MPIVISDKQRDHLPPGDSLRLSSPEFIQQPALNAARRQRRAVAIRHEMFDLADVGGDGLSR